MSNPYDMVLTTARAGRLKLKGKSTNTSRQGTKRKVHIPEEETKEPEEDIQEQPPKLPKWEETKTDAERKFEEKMRKREEQELAKGAKQSHREKIDDFNKKLDALPTHFDIPKVGPG